MKKKTKEAFKNVFDSIGMYGWSVAGVFTIILAPWMMRVIRMETASWPKINIVLVVVALGAAFLGFFLLEKQGMPAEFKSSVNHRRAATYFAIGISAISLLEKLAGV